MRPDGIPPLPLSAAEVEEVIRRLRSGDASALDLLTHRVQPGVAEAATVKAAFLADVAEGRVSCAAIDRVEATRLLGTMVGGYCVPPLIRLLDDPELRSEACTQLNDILLVPEDDRLQPWSLEEWLARRPEIGPELHLTVFKVDGETTTDDLSPAPQAWSRADIPLHALSLLENRLGSGVAPAEIARLKDLGRPVAFVGD